MKKVMAIHIAAAFLLIAYVNTSHKLEKLFLIFTFFFLFATGLQPCIGQQLNVDSLRLILKTTIADTNRVNILYKLSDALTNKSVR